MNDGHAFSRWDSSDSRDIVVEYKRGEIQKGKAVILDQQDFDLSRRSDSNYSEIAFTAEAVCIREDQSKWPKRFHRPKGK